MLRAIVMAKTVHCYIRSQTFLWKGDTTDFCGLSEKEKELKTVEYIIRHCPSLSNLNLRWLASNFTKG